MKFTEQQVNDLEYWATDAETYLGTVTQLVVHNEEDYKTIINYLLDNDITYVTLSGLIVISDEDYSNYFIDATIS